MMDKLKSEIIEIGRWIWEKDLSAAVSGNISARLGAPRNRQPRRGAISGPEGFLVARNPRDRVPEIVPISGETKVPEISPKFLGASRVLITGHGACLGKLGEKDIGIVDLEGRPLEDKFSPSTEKPFHLSVYKNFDAGAVVHVHPALTNGYFAARETIDFDTFETKLVLGDIPVVDQKTPAITDLAPVVAALKKNNIVVLKHHGVVAIGETLKDAFFLVQTLEEAVKMNWIRDFYGAKTEVVPENNNMSEVAVGERFALFSDAQIKRIVELVNRDEKFRKLSQETNLRTKLAVVLDETQVSYCFDFKDGGIAGTTPSAEGAEFVISGRAEYWRAIFNRQLDPFAATTQKKLRLKGDFAKISRWYVPFNRLFELWKNVPVE